MPNDSSTEDDLGAPRLYLITPPLFDLERFPDTLGRVLDAHDIACIRIGAAGWDEAGLKHAADIVRDQAHQRDVPVLIEDHFRLITPHGLDGVHLSDGRNVRSVRKDIGTDTIVGAACGTSRHDGMAAGEAGADYVSFGPVTPSDLGDGTCAEADLFTWWSEMIEIPVLAEGGLSAASVRSLSPCVDFLAFGAEIWGADDPSAALGELLGG